MSAAWKEGQEEGRHKKTERRKGWKDRRPRQTDDGQVEGQAEVRVSRATVPSHVSF